MFGVRLQSLLECIKFIELNKKADTILLFSQYFVIIEILILKVHAAIVHIAIYRLIASAEDFEAFFLNLVSHTVLEKNYKNIQRMNILKIKQNKFSDIFVLFYEFYPKFV